MKHRKLPLSFSKEKQTLAFGSICFHSAILSNAIHCSLWSQLYKQLPDDLKGYAEVVALSLKVNSQNIQFVLCRR